MGGPGSGRRPKPTELKVLEGKPGHRPLPKGEPKPRKGEPQMPDWLSEAAREKWHDLVPQLREMNLLAQIDGDALGSYCSAWAEFRRCTIELNKRGTVYETATGNLRPRPEVAIRDRAVEQVRRLGQEFGLTPSARARMATPKSQKDEADDLDEMMGQAAQRG